MEKILVTKAHPHAAKIEQLNARRDWMDETTNKHAYMCFPLNLTNRLGWGISFPEDIVFVWDGITDTTPDHIKVLTGDKYVNTDRGNATISFNSGLIFKTDEKTTILTIPSPNLFIRGAHCYTTLISTSFYPHTFPIAWRATEPNIEIRIPANTPVCSILPISLTNLESNYELTLSDTEPGADYFEITKKYGEFSAKKNKNGEWSNLYRDARDYENNIVGSHETKSIRLKTTKCPVTGTANPLES